jgi:hypothetical protein
MKSIGASVLAVVNQLFETVLPEILFSPHVARVSTCASIARPPETVAIMKHAGWLLSFPQHPSAGGPT